MAVKTELDVASIQKLIEPYNLGLIDKISPLLKWQKKFYGKIRNSQSQ